MGQLKPDAVIVADPGVFSLMKTQAPEVEVHLSTQASVINAPGANFWFDQGMERIILARELSIKQLNYLRKIQKY